MSDDINGADPIASISNMQTEHSNKIYTVLSTSTTHSQKFNTKVTEMCIRLKEIKADPTVSIKQFFDSILEKELKDIDGGDKVGVVLNNTTYNKPLYISLRRRDQLSSDVIMGETNKVVQSNEDFSLNEPLNVKISTVHLPRGEKYDLNVHILPFDKFCEKRSRSVVIIKNKDKLCLPRATVVAKALADYLKNKIPSRAYEKINKNELEQRTAAIKICRDAIQACREDDNNIKNFRGDLEDVHKFQQYLLEK